MKIQGKHFVITGGGPGDATTFASILLTNIAVGQFDVGRAGAGRRVLIDHRADQARPAHLRPRSRRWLCDRP